MFKKATREKVPLKICVIGPSGSGKTYSALLLAKGIGGKIAFIDTENGSASLYSHLVDFDVMTLSAPFTNEKFLVAIDAAVKAGYDTVIIDSLSHEWAGSGGLLEQKNELDSKPGSNSYTNWGKPTKEHEKLKEKLVQSPINIIGCMRAKQDHILESKNGKMIPVKVGMGAIQRDGMEYEFTTVFDVDMAHKASTSKDRTGLFCGTPDTPVYFVITEDTGKKFVEWRNQGVDIPKVKTYTSDDYAKVYAVIPALDKPAIATETGIKNKEDFFRLTAQVLEDIAAKYKVQL
jgi:hypothetical protein